MDWSVLLKIGHIIGTVLGVGGDTFGAIFYFYALRDGQLDPSESALVKLSFVILKVGMILLVLTGFGFFLYLRLTGRAELLYEPRLMAKLLIAGILLVNAVALYAKKYPQWIGGAVSVASWYTELILGAWRGLEASFLTIMGWYVAFIVVAAIGERIIRKRLKIPL
jgi:hypothetical protein